MRPHPQVRGIALANITAVALAACSGSRPASPVWTLAPTAAGDGAAQAAAPVASTSSPDSMADMPGMAGMSGGGAGAAAAVSTGAVSYLNLTIVTGDMIGHTEFPAYVPSNPTLPANSTVVVTITNFDDATALPADMKQYASVSGTVADTVQVTPIDPADPNGSAGPTKAISTLDPKAVSHTFTVPGLGLNVPIAAQSRVTFVIHTGAAGTFAWRCFDPCGDGPTGWGTAMAAKSGFMEGTLTVA